MIAAQLFSSTKLFRQILIGLFIIFAIVLYQLFVLIQPAKIVFFDVPGEAILLQTLSGHRILIDGGMTKEVEEKIAADLPFYDQTLDVIILTHPDKDHLLGITQVIKRYSVKNVLLTGTNQQSGLYADFLQQIQNQETKVISLNRKTDIKLPGVDIDILHPINPLIGKTAAPNKSSVVGRITTNNHSLLFTGDITKSEEMKLLRSPQKLTANILDLAHHGSNTSSVIDFIKAVQPTRALASAHKNNPYNHPHGEVLARLNDLKIPLQVTGESGDIAYLLDTRSFLSSLFL